MGGDTSKAAVLQTLGDYDLLEKIAEGGMGSIFRARHRASRQIVAIKIMTPQVAANPVLLSRFKQEFQAASRLDHPNIVRALDYNDTGSTPYLVMEFVDGESLGQRLDREGRMGETEAIRIIAQVAQGLHRAHKQGLIHRDVKPDNILLNQEGVAKLADLGLVKEPDSELNLTKTGRGLGTPHFMAPEQFRNAKSANVLCDVYSLGATLYQMVTGELPFRSTGPLDAWMKKIQNELAPPRQVVPGLSERLDWAILRSMSADPQMRPKSCREFVEDLTGRSTRRPATVEASAPVQELWYLVYKDENGTPHTVKGPAAAVRKSLKDGLLGDASNVRASRSKQGPFEPLCDIPEYRQLVVAAAPLNVQPSAARPRPAATGIANPPPATPKRAPAPAEAFAEPPPDAVPEDEAVAGSFRPAELIKWLVFFAVLLAGAAAAFWFFS